MTTRRYGFLVVSLVLAGRVLAPATELPTFGGTWVSQGPGPIKLARVSGMPPDYPVAGPIQVIVPHPTNADIIWIGAVNGGIWKTTSGLAAKPTWVPVGDDLPSLSIGAMALDPTDATHQTLVAGFGRFSSSGDIGGPRAGVARSTDGGETWTLLPAPELQGKNITAIAARGAIIIAAVDEADTAGCPNVGIFRSTDTGATFTRISGGAGTGLPGGVAFDLAGDPSNDAVFYTVIRDAATCTSGGTNGVYRSADTGATWTKDNPSSVDALLDDSVFTAAALDVDPDGELAVAIANGDQLAGWFIRAVPSGSGVDGVAAHSSHAVYEPIDLPEFDGYGLYVAPGDDGSSPEEMGGLSIIWIFKDLFAGGNRQAGDGDGTVTLPNSIGAVNYTGRLVRCDPSATPGSQCTPLTNCTSASMPGCNGQISTTSNSAPHVNSRDLAVDANGRLLQTDDGGLYARLIYLTLIANWVSLNGNLVTAEMRDVCYDSLHDEVFGSTTTGGSAAQSGSTKEWWQVDPFELGEVAASEGATTTRRFTTSGEGPRGLPPYNREFLHWRDYDSGGLFDEAIVNFPVSVEDIRSIKVCGNAEAPQVGNQVIVLTEDGIYESNDNGSTFAAIGSLIDGTAVDCAPNGAIWGASPHGSNPDGKNAYYREGPDGVMLETVAPPGTSPIKQIHVNPMSSDEAVLFDESGQVFSTNDGGVTWTNVTGDLADGGATDLHSMEYIEGDQPAVVVGADNGVYRLAIADILDPHWQVFGHELPPVPVVSLEYNATRNLVVAGSAGRGALTIQPASHGSVLQLNDAAVPEGDGTANLIIPLTRTAPFTHAATADYVFQMGTASAGTIVSPAGGPIAIPSSGSGNPYGSTISVQGVEGVIQELRVALTFSHTWPNDVDVLLVGPEGESLILMSDAGAHLPVTNVELLFDDDAGPAVPAGELSSGSWRPADYSPADTFPSPAPAGPWGTTLSVFGGTDPNGEWKLFVRDDTSGDSGSIASWHLEIETGGGDVEVEPGTAVFAEGEDTALIAVVINGDTEPEPDETFSLIVTGAVNLGVVETTATVTIVNDDGAPPIPDGDVGIDNVVIDGNGWAGVFIADGDLYLEGGNVTGNGVGIHVDNDAKLQLVNTEVTDNNGAGIVIDSEDSGADNYGVIVTDSVIRDNGEDGIRITGDDDDENSRIVQLVGTVVDDNSDDGVYIDDGGRLEIDGGQIEGNGSDGVEIVRAEGGVAISDATLASNVLAAIAAYPAGETKILRIEGNNVEMVNHTTGLAVNMTVDPDASILPPVMEIDLTSVVIHGSSSDGIRIEENAARRMNVTLFMDLGDIHDNGGAGIRVDRPQSECVENGEGENEGCTGVSIHGALIHDNGESGVHLGGAYIIPRQTGDATFGLGFTSNQVFHNAMEGEGCTVAQTAPQVMIEGPVSLPPETAAICSGSATEQVCTDASSGIFGGVPGGEPAPCRWSGSSCDSVWDLRGALTCDVAATPNQIHSYNTADAAELSVGMYAAGGAEVWADNNAWRTTSQTENVDVDASSFIDADPTCGTVLVCEQ